MSKIKLSRVDNQFVYLGYRKLKSFVYYDKTDLHLRRRLAEFECDPAFKTKLHDVMNVVSSEKPINEPLFKSWLEQISFRAVPKSFEEKENASSDALVEAGLPETGSEQFPKSFFRWANLIRHHFVRMPLLNYTDYSGSLATRSLDELVKTDPRKLELSPRYVNFDECMLLAKSGDIDLGSESAFQWAAKIYKEANRHETQGMKWDSIPVAGEVSDDSL